MSVVSMKALLEGGVHFGHRTRRWNPKMRPYIFTERSKIHIIDLQQTVQRINEYHDLVRRTVADGGTVLFVGTKRQAQATIQTEADRSSMPYVNQRWLGGTLTNWNTIKQRIDYLLRMERRVDAGEFRNLSKKEQLSIQREVDKLNRRIGGLKIMRKLPDMLFVVDTNLEDLSVREANKLKIPILGMVDTNSDPDSINYVIPSNDDAIRAIKLIVSLIADAAEEGMRIREIEMADTGQVSQAELVEMEQYLGPSTLAKLQTADDELDGDGEAPASEVDESIEAIADAITEVDEAIETVADAVIEVEINEVIEATTDRAIEPEVDEAVEASVAEVIDTEVDEATEVAADEVVETKDEEETEA